jgi:hypothetical protein
LDFSSSTLACESSFCLSKAGLLQLLARLALGLPLRLLRPCDFLLDVNNWPAHGIAAQLRHRGVDRLGTLLGHLR